MSEQGGSAEQSRLGAQYELLGDPPAARANDPLLLRVRVRNTGAAAWPNRGAHPVNLSYHWLDSRGQVVDFEGVRATLDAPVRPGGVAEFELLAEPPPGAGAYLLALDLVEEGVGWFSRQGAPPLHISLTVAPAPVRPLVCIVNGNCMRNDALGNHVVSQLRFFEARGYQALALVEHVDPRQPAELRRHIAAVTLDELREGPNNPQTRRAVAHFQRADLYVFNYSTYYPLVDAIRLVSHGVMVFDYHGVTPPELWEGPGIENLIEGQRQVGLVRYADYAIAHSRFTRDELIATGAIPPERVYRAAYTVPLARFRPGPRPAALAARYRLPPDQPVLLYVGRMAANKRIGDLVAALALVRERYPAATLLLVGDDQATPYAREVAKARTLAERLGVADGLIVAGQVADAELAAHYQLADLFVTASVHEGFCIPVVEAMACGVPVVGAHAAALPETIGAGGRTFRPRDPTDLARLAIEILETREWPAAPHDAIPAG